VITLIIDDILVSVKEGEEISILEACKLTGIKVPRFCFHDTLSIAGNCRMCIIKLEIPDKPELDELLLVSCVTMIAPNMVITATDPIISKVREEIVEFLLLNHPLDCPICDQAGECDLQEQSKTFGSSRSKFEFNKVGVKDKNFGVFIKSIMTRCIYCTRCIRFSSEIAGFDFFGTLSRGKTTEIDLHPYSLNFFNSELSGNVVDLCPVGALTLKPYAFKSRPWELKTIETIDLSDSIGSNIYVNYNEGNILRVTPRINYDINNTLISDKTRFLHDSFQSYNLLLNSNSLQELDFLFENLNKKVCVVLSEDTNFENLNLLKKLSYTREKFDVKVLSSVSNSNIIPDSDNLLPKINFDFTLIFFLAVNPRVEVALINARLKQLSSEDYYIFYNLGFKYDSNLKSSFFLNINPQSICNLLSGKVSSLSSILVQAENACFIASSALKFRGFQYGFLHKFFKKINPSIYIFDLLLKSNSAGVLLSNIRSLSKRDLKNFDVFIFLNFRDTVNLRTYLLNYLSDKKIFWLNTHKLDFMPNASVQIPISSIYEETGTFFNTEFRPQSSVKIFNSRLNFLSSFQLFFQLLKSQSARSLSNSYIKFFILDKQKFSMNDDKINTNFFFNNNYENFIKIDNYPYKPGLINFFQSNYVTDFSKNLAVASQEMQKRTINFF
jgi:NADH dehydrogenase/NADH:ubiquinone oxidoreductase subunit G